MTILSRIIIVKKLAGVESTLLPSTSDFVLWYAKNSGGAKYRQLYVKKTELVGGTDRYDQLRLPDGTSRAMTPDEKSGEVTLPAGTRAFQADNLVGAEFRPDTTVAFEFCGVRFHPGQKSHWKTTVNGLKRLSAAQRLISTRGQSLRYVRMLADFAANRVGNVWDDISGSVQSRSDPKIYVVQTSTAMVQRCILMTTDPGDLGTRPNLRIRNRGVRCRALGAAMDHH